MRKKREIMSDVVAPADCALLLRGTDTLTMELRRAGRTEARSKFHLVLRVRSGYTEALVATTVTKVATCTRPGTTEGRNELIGAITAMRDMYELALGMQIPLRQRVFTSVRRNL